MRSAIASSLERSARSFSSRRLTALDFSLVPICADESLPITISIASFIIATVASTMLSASRTTSVCACFCLSSASFVRGFDSSAAASATRRSGFATSVIFCAASKLIFFEMAVSVALMSL